MLTQSLSQQLLVEPLQSESGLQLKVAQLVQHQAMGGMTTPGHHLLQQALQQRRIICCNSVRPAACKGVLSNNSPLLWVKKSG